MGAPLLFQIVTNILLPVAILSLLTWVWSRWNIRRTPHMAPTQKGFSFREEPARIKQMLDETLRPQGFALQTDGHQTRTFRYRRGTFVLEIMRHVNKDQNWFLCHVCSEHEERRIAGFAEPHRLGAPLTDAQLEAFQHELNSFLNGTSE